MKKILIILLIITTATISYAQELSIFDKYEDYDEVTTVVVTKRAFKMLKQISNDTKEGEEFQDLVSGLQGLKVFTTEDTKIAAEIENTFTKYLKTAKLEELMRVKDKDAHVKIYVREGRDEDHVSEFLMLVDNMNTSTKNGERDPKVVVISIVGDIDLNNISKITNKMDIPGGQHMKKAHK